MKKFANLFTALLGATLILSGCGKNASENNERQDHEHTYVNGSHECTICHDVSSCVDLDIDGACDICRASFSQNNLSLIVEYATEPIPYFALEHDFEEKTGNYIETTFTGNVINNIVDIFTATNKYSHTVGEYLEKEAHYLQKVTDLDKYFQVTVRLLYNEANNTTFVDVYKSLYELITFPIDEVEEALSGGGHAEEKLIFPDDGERFLFEGGERDQYCAVTYDGSASAYLTKLAEAGYYIDTSMFDYYPLSDNYRCMSPGRTIAISVADFGSEVQIEFERVDAPRGTEWSDFIKTSLMTLFNEIFPFVNANFDVISEEKASETIELKGYFQVETYQIDAFKYAVEAYEADDSFDEEYTEDGNFYTFSKPLGYFLEKAVISCISGTTTISFMKVFPTYTEFPIEQINYCLGEPYTDEIPAAIGDSFYLYYEDAHPNIALVTVYGSSQNFTDYISALTQANYSIVTGSDGWKIAVGPNRSIQIDLFDGTTVIGEDEVPYYTVEIQKFKDTETYFEFPMDIVLEEMDPDLDFEHNCPIPTGETFKVSYPYGKGVASDIKLDITGGNKEAYLDVIDEAGFAYNARYSDANCKAYSNSNKHIIIYIYNSESNTNYAVEFGEFFF